MVIVSKVRGSIPISISLPSVIKEEQQQQGHYIEVSAKVSRRRVVRILGLVWITLRDSQNVWKSMAAA